MSTLSGKKGLWVNYGILAFMGLLALILHFFTPTPFTLTLAFYSLLLLPGFALSRLFKIEFENDRFGRLILYLALGLIFNLLICLGAILGGLTINILVVLIVSLLIAVFVVALTIDLFFRPQETYALLKFRDFLKLENLIYVFLGFFLIMVLALVDQGGASYSGDPYYHLSTMRKAVEGLPLTIENLSILKGQIDPAYGLPIWHVFLSVGSKITHTSIFSFWDQILVSLTLLVFFIIYWLGLKLFSNKFLAVLGLALFVIYYFEANGYLFVRLPVPDTLAQLALLPLAVALTIQYLGEQKSSFKNLLVIILFLPLMGLIHWSQYFYYLTIIGFWAIFYLIFKYRAEDFKPTIKKFLYVLLGSLPLVLLIFIFLQARGGLISNTIDAFPDIQVRFLNDRFFKFNIFLKYAYFLLPLTLVFMRKNWKLTFLLGLFLAGPIIYNIPGLADFLGRHLSPIYLKRFYLNLSWSYLVGALFIGFLLMLIDRAISRFNKDDKHRLSTILIIAALFLVWLEYAYESLSFIYAWIFSWELNGWFSNHYYWLFAILVPVGLGLYFWEKSSKKVAEITTLKEIDNPLSILIIATMIIFFLSFPAQNFLGKYFKEEIIHHHFFARVREPMLEIINPQRFGGMEVVDFIKKNLPAKSVFDTYSTTTNYSLPTLVDIHIASFTYEKDPSAQYRRLYKNEVPLSEKLALLKPSNIDYLLAAYDRFGKTPFQDNPQYFTKVFDNGGVAIFKVNLAQIRADAP